MEFERVANKEEKKLERPKTSKPSKMVKKRLEVPQVV